MLVLSRRRDEKIVIGGGEIEVVVLHVGTDTVKLGVQASKDVPVYRGELYEQIALVNRAAKTTSLPAAGVVAALREGRPSKQETNLELELDES